MYRLIVGLSLAATLYGCATPAPVSVQNIESSPSSYGVIQGVPASSCSVISAHTKKDGEVVPASYRCLTVEPMAGVPVGVCQNVSGYYTTDGTYVPSHQRCELSSFRSYLATSTQTAYGGTNASSGNYAPCVTSGCGPISVRGYTRKDGTYVRPHTRSSSKR